MNNSGYTYSRIALKGYFEKMQKRMMRQMLNWKRNAVLAYNDLQLNEEAYYTTKLN